MLGNRIGQNIRRVGRVDFFRLEIGKREVVVPDRVIGDYFQLWPGGIKNLDVYFIGQKRQYCIILLSLQFLQQFVGGQYAILSADRHLMPFFLQQTDTGIGNPLRDEDFCHEYE